MKFVVVKKPLSVRIRQYIATRLIDLAYDLSYEAFDTFCADNGWNYCEDCNGRPW